MATRPDEIVPRKFRSGPRLPEAPPLSGGNGHRPTAEERAQRRAERLAAYEQVDDIVIDDLLKLAKGEPDPLVRSGVRLAVLTILQRQRGA